MQFISDSEIYGRVSPLGLEKGERKAGKRQVGREEERVEGEQGRDEC